MHKFLIPIDIHDVQTEFSAVVSELKITGFLCQFKKEKVRENFFSNSPR